MPSSGVRRVARPHRVPAAVRALGTAPNCSTSAPGSRSSTWSLRSCATEEAMGWLRQAARSAVGGGVGFLVRFRHAVLRAGAADGVGDFVLAGAVGARSGVLTGQSGGATDGRLDGARALVGFAHVGTRTRGRVG